MKNLKGYKELSEMNMQQIINYASEMFGMTDFDFASEDMDWDEENGLWSSENNILRAIEIIAEHVEIVFDIDIYEIDERSVEVKDDGQPKEYNDLKVAVFLTKSFNKMAKNFGWLKRQSLHLTGEGRIFKCVNYDTAVNI